jgi:hypothetical protein
LFVEGDAEILGEAHHDEAKALRARRSFFVRARDYCLRGMDVRFNGISKRLYRDPAKASTACA